MGWQCVLVEIAAVFEKSIRQSFYPRRRIPDSLGRPMAANASRSENLPYLFQDRCENIPSQGSSSDANAMVVALLAPRPELEKSLAETAFEESIVTIANMMRLAGWIPRKPCHKVGPADRQAKYSKVY